MEQNEEFSFAQKVKIVGAMSLAALLFMVVVGGTVSYQRQAKIEAAELAKTQLANVEAMKTSFPLYRETKQFKESAKMAMVKISVDDLPATIEAGLDPDFDPNPGCYAPMGEGFWNVSKIGGSTVGSGNNLDNSEANGWGVTENGSITIPAGATYGKYRAIYHIEQIPGQCLDENNEPTDQDSAYIYVFKITPPCPTGVTLTAN